LEPGKKSDALRRHHHFRLTIGNASLEYVLTLPDVIGLLFPEKEKVEPEERLVGGIGIEPMTPTVSR
jgi:hypothetical protein